VRIYFKSRKKRNIYKRAIYERLTGSSRPPEAATHKTAGQVLLRPASEQLYVELLLLDQIASKKSRRNQQFQEAVSSSYSSRNRDSEKSDVEENQKPKEFTL
jgi:hypothetical protein